MPGLLRGVARTAVIAGTATTVSNRVSRRQANKWAQQGQAEPAYMAPVQTAPQEAYAPPPAAPAAPAVDYETKLSQLTQLGQLRDAGVLTDAEFEMQKSKILNS
jgi:Short C-terminal domain